MEQLSIKGLHGPPAAGEIQLSRAYRPPMASRDWKGFIISISGKHWHHSTDPTMTASRNNQMHHVAVLSPTFHCRHSETDSKDPWAISLGYHHVLLSTIQYFIFYCSRLLLLQVYLTNPTDIQLAQVTWGASPWRNTRHPCLSRKRRGHVISGIFPNRQYIPILLNSGVAM